MPGSLLFLVSRVGQAWVMVGMLFLIELQHISGDRHHIGSGHAWALIGKVAALYFLIANMLGLSLGPTVFALAAKRFFSGPLAIITAIQLCFPIAMLTAVAFLAYAVRQLHKLRPV